MIYLTTSEARAEACTLLLRLLLRRISGSDLRRLFAEAFVEAERIGEKAITDEVQWLFHDLKM